MLDAARRAGADAADAIAIDSASLRVEVRGGALEHAERADGVEIGLRALAGTRQACVSASDARPETLADIADRAVAMARAAPEDPAIGLADPADLCAARDARALDLVDAAPDPTPARLAAAARAAEAAALAIGDISQAQAAAGVVRRRIHLAATNGFSGGYATSGHGLSCVAIAGEGAGMERDHFGDRRVHAADLWPAEDIGRIAAERAVARVGARKPPTGAFPAVYDERIAAGLIGHLAAAANGAAIVRGASWLRDALGARVLPAGVTLTENPHRPRVGGSRPFDAEGLPTARRDIVADGVLTGWVLDLASARKLGMDSTANASRTPAGPPAPSVGNLDLTQGALDRDGLVREMGTGLLITALMGASINPNTGDYSRGASGFWVENGRIAYPVNECTVAGNLREMLKGIRPANDARPHSSRAIPSLLVEGLTIAGA